MFVALTNIAAAQTPDPASPVVTFYFRDVTRAESWSFFDPPAGGGDPTYSLFGNRATLGVLVSGRRFDLEGAFEYGQLLNLPERSIGPGPLGPGALYFEAARAPAAYQLYFRALSVRAKNIVPGLSVQAGRMPYRSGNATPPNSDAVDIVTRARVESRLIGEFEWSMFPRSFDGVRVDVDRPRWHANGALIFPTQGAYEESANPTISKLRILAGEGGTKNIQLFAYHYRDRRDVTGRPDNSFLSAATTDISILTIGGSHVGVYPAGPGQIDSVVWGATQRGDWYGLDHRGSSVAIEGGYQLNRGWRPWLRAGFLHAAGDDDPFDRTHNTFFQMLPSSNRYSRSHTYAQMNIRDRFAQLRLTPRPNLQVGVDVHRVALDESADRWYTGSGASAREGAFFGYTARRSFGVTPLGTIIEGSADVTLEKRWSMVGYLGWMNGGEVVNRLFAGDNLVFFYIENVLNFSK